MLLAGVSLALLAVRVTLLQASKSAQSARRYIDCLCSMELHALNDEEPLDAVEQEEGEEDDACGPHAFSQGPQHAEEEQADQRFVQRGGVDRIGDLLGVRRDQENAHRTDP